MKAWIPRPTAGDMSICGSCRHHREDRRRAWRCALTIQNPYLPPLVAWKPAGDPKGLELCSQFEPARGRPTEAAQIEMEAQ